MIPAYPHSPWGPYVSTNVSNQSSARAIKVGIAAVLTACTLAACGSSNWGFPYRAGVQQGNWITQEQVALLQPGMTREQVRFALGSPTLTSVLHSNRWDYPYFFKPGYGTSDERKFTVFFENDQLVRWEGDAQPELQPFQIVEQDATKSMSRQNRIEQQSTRERTDQPQGQITPTIPTRNDPVDAAPPPNL